jgi:hypothetical protein
VKLGVDIPVVLEGKANIDRANMIGVIVNPGVGSAADIYPI